MLKATADPGPVRGAARTGRTVTPAGNSQQAAAACTKHETIIRRMLWIDLHSSFCLYRNSLLSHLSIRCFLGAAETAPVPLPRLRTHHCSEHKHGCGDTAGTQLSSELSCWSRAARGRPCVLGQVPPPHTHNLTQAQAKPRLELHLPQGTLDHTSYLENTGCSHF